jgi:hypothetical protein
MEEKFWTENPVDLFKLKFIPNCDMSAAEKMNLFTRYALLSGIVIGIVPCLFIILALVIIYHSMKCDPEFLGKPRIKNQKEDYVSPLTSGQNFDGSFTYSAPVFSEEWQINPQEYESRESLVRNVPTNVAIIENSLADYEPKPYGQYITELNPNVDLLLPEDVNFLNSTTDRLRMTGGGSLRKAREYANSNFIKNAVAYRDTMTALHKNRLNRRYTCNSVNDTYSPYYSY